MTLLSIAELHLLAPETKPVPADALQLLLDDAQGDIEEVAGPIGEITERHAASGFSSLVTDRPIASISGITVGNTSLAVDHFSFSGSVIYRAGASPWRGPVEITYTPVDDTVARKAAQVELVRLAVSQSGYRQESSPEFARTRADINDERRDVLNTLRPQAVPIL